MRDLLQGIFNEVIALKTIEAIRLRDFELPNHPRHGDPRRLLRYQFQVCSQNGEDGIIAEIFRRVGMTDRIFAEVGVGDGKQNNTVFLISQGWTGFWIDGADAFSQVVKNSRGVPGGSLRWLVASVTRENIATLFDQLGVPRELDLLSLDIDQNTYYAWEGLSGFRPRVIVVEYNPVIPPDVDWKAAYDPDRTWDLTHNYSASLKALENLGRERGYSLVGCEFTGNNAFFVRDDLVGDRFAAPFTAENHHEPARYSFLHRRGHAPSVLDLAGHP